MLKSDSWPYRDPRVVEEDIPEYDPDAVKLIEERTIHIATYLGEVLGIRSELTMNEVFAMEKDIAEEIDTYRAFVRQDGAINLRKYLEEKGPIYMRGLLCNIGRASSCLSVFESDISVFRDNATALKSVMKPFKVDAMLALLGSVKDFKNTRTIQVIKI